MSEKIKSIKATRYDQKLDSILDKEFKTVESPLSIKEYDENNRIIHESNWGVGGMLSEKFTYEYEGNLLVKRSIFSEEDEVAETETFRYDEEGRMIETCLEYFDGSKDITTHQYDSNGMKISSTTIDDDDEDGQQEFWEYDNGLLVLYKLINDFGALEIEQKMQYNSQGKAIRKDYFNSLEESKYYVVFQYDDQDRLSLELTYNTRDKLIEEKSFQYNQEGKLLIEKAENAKETRVKKFEYDPRGNNIYQIEKEEDEGVVNYELWRSYDEFDQVIKSRVMVNGNGESQDIQYEVSYAYEYFK